MFCGKTTKPKAKMDHRCTSCGELIEAGTEYIKWVSIDDGKPFTNKMHPECLEAHQDNARNFGDSEWEYQLYGHKRGSVE